MPQRRQPKSLVDISVTETAQNIYKFCADVESMWGDYDEPVCRSIIQAFQQHLLETLPAALLDKLCERRTQSLEYELRDHRVLLAVYLHKNTRGFSCSTMTLRAITDEGFWLQQLALLKNIVTLDFKLMCTDEILKVVGENCSKLEYINCISKMSTMSRSSSNLSFNALRVELFVSDEGLNYLTNCKKLKKITMNKKINSQCAGKKPTIDGVRNLLKALPELQCLTFDDLGSVISSNMEDSAPLVLQQLSDTHPSPQHITEIAKLCPNLKKLMLITPIDANTNTASVSGILDTLAETNLNLELLGLEHFPFDEDLINYLSVKGEYLTCLQLYSFRNQMTSFELFIIGETCINLTGLHLHGLIAERGRMYNTTVTKTNQKFQKLTCISLGGDNWDPCVILPMCVIPAQKLVRLSLFNKGSEISLNDLFLQLMSVHQFKSFKMLNLIDGCIISLQTLQKFIYHCPVISVVKVRPIVFTRSDADILIKEFNDNNLNFTMDVY